MVDAHHEYGRRNETLVEASESFKLFDVSYRFKHVAVRVLRHLTIVECALEPTVLNSCCYNEERMGKNLSDYERKRPDHKALFKVVSGLLVLDFLFTSLFVKLFNGPLF
jgi:hypothetical protein